MKKLILILLLLAPFAGAQETYSITVNAGGQAAVERFRLIHNVATCLRWQQPANCTTLPDVPAPTEADPNATAPNPDRLYANTTNGRAAVIRDYFGNLVPAPNAPIVRETAHRLKWETLTQPQKDAWCAAKGDVAGCDPFAR